MEVKFDQHLWQWEEEPTVFSLEEVGLGKEFKSSMYTFEYLYLYIKYLIIALIINVIGLGLSTIVFIIEKLFPR